MTPVLISTSKNLEKTIPEAEYMDTWVWFQSGINTDGAHNPKTNRVLKKGDILSLNTFPMISGYYTALERTMFVEEVDDESLKAWEANINVHKRGLELIKPGAKCSEICEELNDLFAQLGYLQYRTFGYGHSFGMLSHFYGREELSSRPIFPSSRLRFVEIRLNSLTIVILSCRAVELSPVISVILSNLIIGLRSVIADR